MPLPGAFSSHHTAWVTAPGSRPHPVRYAIDGPRLVCFGDTDLAGVSDSTRVSVSVHAIAGGQQLAAFNASLRYLPAASVPAGALVELLEHVPLGRTLEEVQIHLAGVQAERLVVELVPQ